MPIVTSGTSAPPTLALFAVSEATIPYSEPLPTFSGCFETLRATPWATIDEMLAPTPGRMPIQVPRLGV
jgi:hypothetical protein